MIERCNYCNDTHETEKLSTNGMSSKTCPMIPDGILISFDPDARGDIPSATMLPETYWDLKWEASPVTVGHDPATQVITCTNSDGNIISEHYAGEILGK